LLRELFSNLVDNAVKYSATGGAVTVRCGDEMPAQAGGYQFFPEVEDDGPCIAAP
jgi:two-component system sensor histidine kinase TctE